MVEPNNILTVNIVPDDEGHRFTNLLTLREETLPHHGWAHLIYTISSQGIVHLVHLVFRVSVKLDLAVVVVLSGTKSSTSDLVLAKYSLSKLFCLYARVTVGSSHQFSSRSHQFSSRSLGRMTVYTRLSRRYWTNRIRNLQQALASTRFWFQLKAFISR